MPKREKKPKYIKYNTIKEYISSTLKLRSTDKTVKRFIKQFDTAIEAALKDAGKSTKENRRKTVMNKDMLPALEKHLGKRQLTWQEAAEQILKYPAADLGKISKTINNYLRKEEE